MTSRLALLPGPTGTLAGSTAGGTATDGGPERALGWNALRQLVLGRILVASLALPSGLLLRPDVTSRPLTLLALGLGAVAGVSIAWTLGRRLARGLRLQTATQLSVDLMLVTWLAAYTGGRGSQFVLFYALVVITGGVLGRVGGKALYAYDMGDGWEHSIVLEGRLPMDPGTAYPVCTGGAGACPPEDCGGIPGFYELVDILADPKHERHEEMLEWVGEDYDPNAFSIEEVNDRLAPIRRTRSR